MNVVDCQFDALYTYTVTYAKDIYNLAFYGLSGCMWVERETKAKQMVFYFFLGYRKSA